MVDGLSHLRSLVNLESLHLGVTVYRVEGYKPENPVPHEELEATVWKLIRANARDGTTAVVSPDAGIGADSKRQEAALRAEARQLIAEAEALLQRATELLKRAARRSR